jgi:hypothetical protein
VATQEVMDSEGLWVETAIPPPTSPIAEIRQRARAAYDCTLYANRVGGDGLKG